MKKLCLFSLLINLCLYGSAQNFQWAGSFGLDDIDEGHSILTDHSGNVYTSGFFIGSVDFDPGLTPADTFYMNSTGYSSFFLTKSDAAGNFLWAKTFNNMPSGGSFSYSAGESSAIDAAGNLYFTGTFGGTGDFNPGLAPADTFSLTSTGNFGIFILKLDSSGNFVWAKSIETTSYNGIDGTGRTVATDASGNVYLTGYFNGTGDFNPSTAPADTFYLPVDAGAFILKLDSSGNFVWARNFGGPGFAIGTAIAIDNTGNVFTCGEFGETVDFNPGTNPSDTFNITVLGFGFRGCYISKLDSSGNFVWAKNFATFDAGSSCYPGDLVLDENGKIYTTGDFSGKVDFNTDTAAADTFYLEAPNNAFITKLDPDGRLIWAKNIQGNANTAGFSLAVDTYGNVYNMGHLGDDGDTADFNPGLSPAETYELISYGLKDMYFLRLDSAGNFNWASHIGGTGFNPVYAYTEGYSLCMDTSGNIYTTGSFRETVDFNPDPAINFNMAAINVNSASDVFILKLCTPPDPSRSITGATVACAGDQVVYFISDVQFATGYTWSVPPGAVINAGQNTTSITVTYGSTSGTVTVVPDNACAVSYSQDTLVVSVTPLPIIATQPSDQIVIVGNNAQFTASTINPGATFQWQEDAGAGFISLTNTPPYAGVTTTTLTVSTVTLAQNNNHYRCVITDGNCSVNTQSALLTVLNNAGINELLAANGFALYPNPSKAAITIQTTGLSASSPYRIFDIAGRVILSGLLKDKSTAIDISFLEAGIYFVQAGEKNKLPVKLVKE